MLGKIHLHPFWGHFRPWSSPGKPQASPWVKKSKNNFLLFFRELSHSDAKNRKKTFFWFLPIGGHPRWGDRIFWVKKFFFRQLSWKLLNLDSLNLPKVWIGLIFTYTHTDARTHTHTHTLTSAISYQPSAINHQPSSINCQPSASIHQLFSYPLSHCNPRWVHIILACFFQFLTILSRKLN